METGEYGLTRGTCFVASRPKVLAVAGLLWISWCVLGAAGFRFFFRSFFFERTRHSASMRPPCLIYLSTSTDCESGTRPIFIKPGSMEAGKNVLTRGTCFVTCRYEGVADAGLLWISRCVLGAAGFRVLFSFFSTNARGLLHVYIGPPCS